MKIKTIGTLLLVGSAAFGFFAGSFAFAAAAPVGTRGQPEDISIIGSRQFSEEQIRGALVTDFSFWLKGSRYAPLDDFLEYLRNSVREGYLRAGFGKVEVSAETDAEGRIAVKIVEGPRYRAGEVVVSGNRDLPRDLIVERLTTTARPEPWTPEASLNRDEGEPEIIWPREGYARLDEVTRQAVAEAVTALYREAGYFDAEIKTGYRLGGNFQARLQIDIIDQGPGFRLGEIRIEGADSFPEESLRQLIPVAPGDVIGDLTINEIERRLWNLGIYSSYEVELAPSLLTDRRDLRIVLEEMPEVRPWTESAGEVEEILRKAHGWLYDAPNWQNDLVIAVGARLTKPADRKVSATIVFSPGRGMYLEAGRLGRIYITPESINWSLEGLKLKGGGEAPSQQAYFNINVHPGTADFGFGLGSPRREGDPVLDFRVAVAPAAIGHLAKTLADWNTLTVAEGSLIAETGTTRVEFDAATGELRHFFAQSDQDFYIEIETRPGVFEEKIREFDSAVFNYVPVDNILVAAGLLLFDRAYRSTGEERARAREILLAAHLQKAGELEFFKSFGRRSGDSFVIPRPPDQDAGAGGQLQVLIHLLPQIAHAAFLPDSWPWTVSRGLALALGGDPREFSHGLKSFYGSADTGPLGCLAFAALSQGKLKTAWVGKGLFRLDFEFFLGDFQSLFPEGKFPRKMIEWELEVLRGLDRTDLDTIIRGLGEGLGGRLLEEFREQCGDPAADCLPHLLRVLWEEYLEGQVRERLEQAAMSAAGDARPRK